MSDNAAAIIQKAREWTERQDRAVNPESWMEEFMLSDNDIAELEDAEFIIPDFIIASHIAVIAAQPGKGKTTIAMCEAANMVKAGYRVMYVNMDCGASDVKYWHQQAKAGGFKMITPHFNGAEGVKRWKQGLADMVNSGSDLAGLVVVVDTLKKVSDMLNKAQVRGTFNLLRALTAKGATVVCLAHCNKHRDNDGGLVFEGTGDVMSDCDDMLYLDSDKDSFGVRTVSTIPTDKVRGIFHPRSWEIRSDRSVRPLDEFQDVTAKVRAQTQLEQDAATIEVITQGIRSGQHLRSKLQMHCKEEGVSKRAFDKVIKRYCKGSAPAKTTPLWLNQPQFENNASYYILLESENA